ncbi:CRISPR-associated helicase Cas3' [Vibrio barjaei]|uniref:CRISPR-associated helicase Cas3' n=1 Tax=Vibrio barjaei TaxID=1676683 RepID=UPI002283D473|nr:CRISPR-associated helicase Cas3' [Vibrio barjaei]MCY9870335.1 CRISPR-associated helicase Cas3' [Vibrio barjaei]
MKKRKQTRTNTEVPVIPYEELPAKTIRANSEVKLGMSVYHHCKAVGMLAELLLGDSLSRYSDAKWIKAVGLIAALHDLGKVSPTFAYRLFDAAADPRKKSLHMFSTLSSNESAWGGHAGVTAIAMSDLECPKSWMVCAASHHGSMPNISDKKEGMAIFGGVGWAKERRRLFERLHRDFGSPELVDIPEEYIDFVSGVVSVSDWLGSSESMSSMSRSSLSTCSRVYTNSGLSAGEVQEGVTFEQLFGFPMNGTQKAADASYQGPGVYLIESPMGEGKTEAALWLAYRAMCDGARGIYFGLPTRLTSDLIHRRVSEFIGKVSRKDVLLNHSSSKQSKARLGISHIGSEWFEASKRGLLAPFGVGTVDQCLLSVMNVRHGFVRSFGLSGKVVILDELHTYDAYSSLLLKELIGFLESVGCTVIILSATLSKGKKEELLKSSNSKESYPLITASCNGEIKEIVPSDFKAKTVHVNVSDDRANCESWALSKAATGQLGLWIENTVSDAQRTYECLRDLADKLDIELELIHSQYTGVDRAEKESLIESVLGKNSGDKRYSAKRIVIGTQILEQSLDIDADFLVTNIAPTDMLLQRMGRLWRHERENRPETARPEVMVMAPNWEDALREPRESFGGSAAVYSEYLLLRTLEVFESYRDCGHLSLPEDMRSLIEMTYSERVECGEMAHWHSVLFFGECGVGGIESQRQYGLGSLSEAVRTKRESEVSTRYSLHEMGKVLLVKSIEFCQETSRCIIESIKGRQIVIDQGMDTEKKSSILSDIESLMVPCAKYP